MENQTNEAPVVRMYPHRPLAAQWMVSITVVALVLAGYCFIAAAALSMFKAQLDSVIRWMNPGYMGLFVAGVILVVIVLQLPGIIRVLYEGIWRILDARSIRADLREGARR